MNKLHPSAVLHKFQASTKTILPLVQRSIYLGIVVFVVVAVARNFDYILSLRDDLDLGTLLLAGGLVLLHYLGVSAAWTWVVRQYDVKIAYPDGMVLYLQSYLAKYIPGGFWAFVNMGLQSTTTAIPALLSVYTLFFVMVVNTLAAANFSIPAAVYILFGMSGAVALWLSLVGMLLVALLSPVLIRFGLSLLSRLRGAERIGRYSATLSVGRVYIAFAILSMIMLPLLASFVLVFQQMGRAASLNGVLVASIWILSWLIGFLSFIFPSGIGVREGSIVLLVGARLPAQTAVSIAFVHRVLLLVVEALLLVLMMLFAYIRKLILLHT